jgi:exodeoxyribonuclease-1
MLYCKPANDFLPDPQSCLITGITPQQCLEWGVPEHRFAATIEQAFSQPGTIGVGYNTIRFDDEITRFMFWRNLIDPYAREWQNGCGRWDLLDVVRMTYALRPEGIIWPTKEDGKPSFKLEDLAANGLVHEAAHDALSDVRATIALARLIRQHQPKLFDFCLALHKRTAWPTKWACTWHRPAPALPARIGHVPGGTRLSGAGLAAGHAPDQQERTDRVGLRLRSARAVHARCRHHPHRIFTRSDAMPEGMTRLPVKSVHLNKSPMLVANLKTLSPAMAAKWGLDLEQGKAHAAIAAELAAAGPNMDAIWAEVFYRPAGAPLDVDEDLYNGFVSKDDRRLLDGLRKESPARLAAASPAFSDARLGELLFRYRARNFPETLSETEFEHWEQHRAARFYDGAGGVRSIDQFFGEIDHLQQDADERAEQILSELYEYVELIAPAQ